MIDVVGKLNWERDDSWLRSQKIHSYDRNGADSVLAARTWWVMKEHATFWFSLSHATGETITKPRDCRDLDGDGSVNFAWFLLRAARNLIYSGMKWRIKLVRSFIQQDGIANRHNANMS